MGGGAGLTNVNAALLNGLSAPAFGRLGSSNTWTNSNIFQDPANIFNGNGNGLTSLNASRITAGTLNDLRLSSNVALLDDSQAFTGQNTFTGGFVTNAFQLTDSPTSGYVLKANSLGTGTWQPDGLTMPESDSISGSGTGLAFTHTGTGDLSIFTINNASSVAEAVQGNSNNGGDVFQATMTGIGRAGYFAISNSSSTNDALHVTTNATDQSAGAIFALATANSGNSFGVRGESEGNAGVGVFGIASSDVGSNVGGYFSSYSADGKGVWGNAAATSGTTSYAVFGSQGFSNEGYAIFASGDLGASGTKTFRIDHPFDPENKYLLHYSTESPTPQNFYVGNTITDARGYAWVELPDYFAEINTNFKYQLTVVDDADSDGFVMAKVSKKIRGTRFQVRTSEPNVEVSWRVDADRNDLWARHKKPKDVVEKQGTERGTYQRPELYGLGPERGMDYRPKENSSATRSRRVARPGEK
ncbi:MAG: hypothetical protein WAO58_04340 [Fimbriimonadaceae bacterium]